MPAKSFPKAGVYVTKELGQIFILSKVDGPYQVWNEKKKVLENSWIGLCTFENQRGVFPKTKLDERVLDTAKRIGSF